MSQRPQASANATSLNKFPRGDERELILVLKGEQARYVREMARLVNATELFLVQCLIEMEAKKSCIIQNKGVMPAASIKGFERLFA